MSPDANRELPTATIRSRPEDFVVDEIPAYEATGSGEHLFVRFRKTSLTTFDVVRALANGLEVSERASGTAGLKDRNAVTTQTVSLPFPIARDAETAIAALSIPGVEILQAKRHINKLKPGHLKGNRFRVTLRDLGECDVPGVVEALERMGREGLPNRFGPQRFGNYGDNADRALAWLRGSERPPRDRRQQRLLFSALQSHLFNLVLSERERDESWNRVLPGDLAKKADTGGLFLVPAEGEALVDAETRANGGLVSATGPMFGSKMTWPEGKPLDIERAVLDGLMRGPGAQPDPDAALHRLGPGTRRPLRMLLDGLRIEHEPGALVVEFALPKGGYATSVLGRACRLVEAKSLRDSVSSPEAESHEPDADDEES